MDYLKYIFKLSTMHQEIIDSEKVSEMRAWINEQNFRETKIYKVPRFGRPIGVNLFIHISKQENAAIFKLFWIDDIIEENVL